MTRAHAARQLLALGPLTWGQFVTITGWSLRNARHTLRHLMANGEVTFEGSAHRGVYQVAASTNKPQLSAS